MLNGFPDGTGIMTSIGVYDYKEVWGSQISMLELALWSLVVYTLWSMRKTIAEGLSKAFKKVTEKKRNLY